MRPFPLERATKFEYIPNLIILQLYFLDPLLRPSLKFLLPSGQKRGILKNCHKTRLALKPGLVFRQALVAQVDRAQDS